MKRLSVCFLATLSAFGNDSLKIYDKHNVQPNQSFNQRNDFDQRAFDQRTQYEIRHTENNLDQSVNVNNIQQHVHNTVIVADTQQAQPKATQQYSKELKFQDQKDAEVVVGILVITSLVMVLISKKVNFYSKVFASGMLTWIFAQAAHNESVKAKEDEKKKLTTNEESKTDQNAAIESTPKPKAALALADAPKPKAALALADAPKSTVKSQQELSADAAEKRRA